MNNNNKLKCGAKRKFYVLKIEDVEFLSDKKQYQLKMICDMIEYDRIRVNKKIDNEYIVINTDEPYFEEIKAILVKNNHWG